jgi:hypothetical protein
MKDYNRCDFPVIHGILFAVQNGGKQCPILVVGCMPFCALLS